MELEFQVLQAYSDTPVPRVLFKTMRLFFAEGEQVVALIEHQEKIDGKPETVTEIQIDGGLTPRGYVVSGSVAEVADKIRVAAIC
jgi:uncharacterized protein YlzI (FlbEa/FlbD family)